MIISAVLRALRLHRLRESLSPKVCNLPLVQAVQRTMVQGRNYGPQVGHVHPERLYVT